MTLEEALLGAEVRVETLKGSVLLKIPAGTQAGRTFRLTGQGMPRFKRERPWRPVRQGQGHPADQSVTPRQKRPRVASSSSSSNPTRADRRAPTRRDRPCNSTASPRRPRRRSSPPRPPPNASTARSSTPSTSSSALVEPDDGMPAETLRRLGVDLPGFRGELAAILARRARIQGGSLTLDPRARHVVELAEAEARRLGDEYVSTEHLLLGVAEVGGEGQALLDRHAAGREAILQACRAFAAASGSPRRTPKVPTPPSRSTGATSPPRPGRASSTRSSVATRRSAGSSRCCRDGPRTTPC